MSSMQLSSNGFAELKQAEAFMPKLYDDGGSKGVGHCTIGYGHLVHYDPCGGNKYLSEHQFINGITVKKATLLLRKDVMWAEKAVNDLVKVPLTQNQFDALTIFTFNVGENAFSRSTLLRTINSGNFKAVPAGFRMWNKSKGKMLAGLVNRREREIRIFEKK